MIGLIADVHVGNHKRHGGPLVAGLNVRCLEVLATLERAVKLAEARGCSDLFILGDLVDTTLPAPQLLSRLQQICADSSLIIHILKGNHDENSDSAGDHALGPLSPVARVVAESQRIQICGLDLLLVPFQSGAADLWLPGVVEELTRAPSNKPRALLTHLGIRGPDCAPFLKDSHDSVGLELLQELAASHRISGVFAGNWHGRYTWSLDGRAFMQVGTLCPTGWDNPGLKGYGTLALIASDPARPTFEVVPGPRFLSVSSRDELDQVLPLQRQRGHQVYVQWKCEVEEYKEAQALLQAQVAEGNLRAGEAIPDNVEAIVAARSSAVAARQAATMEEAIESYVRAMELPPSIECSAVIQRVRRYLGA